MNLWRTPELRSSIAFTNFGFHGGIPAPKVPSAAVITHAPFDKYFPWQQFGNPFLISSI